MAGALAVDKVGRRKLWLSSAGGMLFAYTLWTIGSGVYANSGQTNKSAGTLVLAMIFIYYAAYNIAMSALLVSYTVEM